MEEKNSPSNEKSKTGLINDVQQTVTEGINNRLNTPFMSSLVISFLVWNWAGFLYLIFDKDEIGVKIYKIVNHPCAGWNIFIPILSALILPVLIGYMDALFNFLRKGSERKKADARNKLRFEKSMSDILSERDIQDQKALKLNKTKIEQLLTEISEKEQEILKATSINESLENRLMHYRKSDRSNLFKSFILDSSDLIDLTLPGLIEDMHKNIFIGNRRGVFNQPDLLHLFRRLSNDKTYSAEDLVLKKFLELGVIKIENKLMSLTDFGKYVKTLYFIDVTFLSQSQEAVTNFLKEKGIL